MRALDLVIRGRRVVTPEGERAAALWIRDGVVEQVAPFEAVPDAAAVVDAGAAVVMPGLVDTHVHVNEPGRSEWEGFETATRAAAAGGVTTLLDMPLNCVPPTTTVGHLETKAAAAEGRCWVDVGFWGGAVPGNTADLRDLHEAGVFGFKAFLVPSGVEEFPCLPLGDLPAVMAELATLDALLIVHAELPGPIDAATQRLLAAGADPRHYATYLQSRPAAAEEDAVDVVLAAAGEQGCRVHVLHLSAAGALPLLHDAKAAGAAVTVETCPHYLALTAEEVPDAATAYKCAPPIREASNRERLWAGLRHGWIDAVVSDHSPCPPALKRADGGGFLQAWGGIASLQLGLAVTWTQARARGHTVADVAGWMAAAPARLAGLRGKGLLVAGCDADVVIWDPEAVMVVDPQRLEQRHPQTPYAGRRLFGVVQATYLRGEPVYQHGRLAPHPRGRLLSRDAA